MVDGNNLESSWRSGMKHPTELRSHVRTPQDTGIGIDLAGEAAGMRSEALVGNPSEPRLFVYRRDGSALELLRRKDVESWFQKLDALRLQRPETAGQGHGKAQDVAEIGNDSFLLRIRQCDGNLDGPQAREVSLSIT